MRSTGIPSHHPTIPYEEQFKTDSDTWKNYLGHQYTNSNSSQRQAILKRIFLTLDEGNIEFKNRKDDDYQPVGEVNKTLEEDKKVPLASLLSHGGRVMVEIPPHKPGEDPQAFFNWLMGNNKPDNAKKNPVVIQRTAATHSLVVTNGEIEELKTGITKPIPTVGDILKKNHFGINVGLGDGEIAEDNGSNGHVYVYWLAPTSTSPGGLLIGCEGSEPGKINRFGDEHTWRAKASQYSPTGGNKFADLTDSPIQPSKVGGIRVKLSSDQVDDLLHQESTNFELEKLSQPVGEGKRIGLSVTLSEELAATPAKTSRAESRKKIDNPPRAKNKKEEKSTSKTNGEVAETKKTEVSSLRPTMPPPTLFADSKTFVSEITPLRKKLTTITSNSYSVVTKDAHFEAQPTNNQYQPFTIEPSKLITELNLSEKTSAINTFKAMLESYKAIYRNRLPKITTTNEAKELWREALKSVYPGLNPDKLFAVSIPSITSPPAYPAPRPVR